MPFHLVSASALVEDSEASVGEIAEEKYSADEDFSARLLVAPRANQKRNGTGNIPQIRKRAASADR